MRVLVTGSAGHLGEALMRTLAGYGHEPVGLDRLASPYTQHVGTITDRAVVKEAVAGVQAIIHAATLHKPHVVTHSKQSFVDTNITGTLHLLEEAVKANVTTFLFTSTTSTFGVSLTPPAGEPAAWIEESVACVPKNIYGATKVAAEDLCELFFRTQGLNVLVLRTSRFFPEDDDAKAVRVAYTNANAKANEFLFRRVDLEDAVTAHVLALDRAPSLGFGRYIISATTPFTRDDLPGLRAQPGDVVKAKFPQYPGIYDKHAFKMFQSIDRVYVNARARADLGWQPKYDFQVILDQLAAGDPIGSELARTIGRKQYHAESYEHGPYPV